MQFSKSSRHGGALRLGAVVYDKLNLLLHLPSSGTVAPCALLRVHI